MTSLDSLSLKCWEIVSEAGFVAVIIGVALEVVELVGKWFERCKKERLPKRIRRWLLPVETIGFAILIIGLAVEFLGSHKAMQIADRENARLNKLAEDSRLKADELEAKMKPRTITSEQQTNLIECLSRAPQKGKINVFAGIFDAEAVGFAEQISNVLAQAGFEVHCPLRLGSDSMLVIGPPGAHIVVKSVENPSSPVGAYMQKCFLSVGIELPAINSSNPNFGSDSIEIDIGQK
jgi:hypothetical protein